METYIRGLGEVVGLCFGTVGEGSRLVHKLAQDCAAAIGRNGFDAGVIRVASVDDAVARAKRRVYREWGLAAVVGRAQCLLSVLDTAVSRKPQLPPDPGVDELAEFADRAAVDPSPLCPTFDPGSRSPDVFPGGARVLS